MKILMNLVAKTVLCRESSTPRRVFTGKNADSRFKGTVVLQIWGEGDEDASDGISRESEGWG